MNRKITHIIMIFSILLSCAAAAAAFEFKGYEWGQPLQKTMDKLESRDKQPVYYEQAGTLVYSDTYYGTQCKVSLLFTPVSGELAGIALVWEDDSSFKRAEEDLVRKYGQALRPRTRSRDVKYFLWKSPTNDFARIALINDRRATVLGYYGGEFYEKYLKESGTESAGQ